MSDPAPELALFQKGLLLTRHILDVEKDSDAEALILETVLGLTHAHRVHLFTLNASGEPELYRSTSKTPLPDAERESCLEVMKAPLERHRLRHPDPGLADAGPAPPDTDDSLPLWTVAKVIAHREIVFFVAVIVKEGVLPFTEDDQRFFGSLCLNAGSGLGRRRPPARVQRGAAAEPPELARDAKLAAKIKEVKTRRLRLPRSRFEQPFGGILGKSPQVVELRETIHRYGPENLPVLIIGETGTGKELVARAIHEVSPRRKGPLCCANAASLQPTLIASELFGHVKGSFTGAQSNKKGLFRAAEGGTVFLDEVGELPLDMQGLLLRTLQEGTVKPVGSDDEIKVDFRLIVATNRDLKQLVKEGRFRADLYHRLHVLDVFMPPLRERKGDAVFLAEAFLAEEAGRRPGRSFSFSAAALLAIENAPWEGNIRELKNSVLRAVVNTRTGVIEPRDLGLVSADDDPRLDAAGNAERRRVLAVLRKHRGNRTQAGEELGIHRTTVPSVMQRLFITDEHVAN